MIDVKLITSLHRNTTKLWHQQEVENPHRDLLYLVCEQHKFNFLLWHEEDIARSPDVGDAKIATVKRAIDGYNQKRNDAIEKIDDYLKRDSRNSRHRCRAGGKTEYRNARPGNRSAFDPGATHLSHGRATGTR